MSSGIAPDERRLRIGFHYHVGARREPDGGLATGGSQGRFIDSLAEHCERVVCFLHGAREEEETDYRIEAPNVEWVDIGPRPSVLHRTLLARRYTAALRRHPDGLDVLLLRAPTPLLPQMAKALRGPRVALLVVGKYSGIIDALPQPAWRKLLIRWWVRWYERRERATSSTAITLVNNPLTFQEFSSHAPELYEVRTTALREGECFGREDTCPMPPYKVLHVGRIVPEKGVSELVEALAVLVSEGVDVELHLVGAPDAGGDYLSYLRRHAEGLGVADRVVHHGFIPFGIDLFDVYKSADLFVVASTASEGFPRTVWEAMAHSLPVVATRVGSIPLVLRHRETALLVDPKDHRSLAAGMKEVLSDRGMRKALIRNGMALARRSTLERQTAKLVRIISTSMETEGFSGELQRGAGS